MQVELFDVVEAISTNIVWLLKQLQELQRILVNLNDLAKLILDGLLHRVYGLSRHVETVLDLAYHFV